MAAPGYELVFFSKDDAEATGLHRKYWNGERVPWMQGRDIQEELERRALERAYMLGDV